MSVANSPETTNFLSPLKFQFFIDKFPNCNFFCQSVSMPNVTLGTSFAPSPFIKLPIPGDHIEYSEMLITFMIDEKMNNYKEMYDWILGLGFPKDFTQYANLAERDRRSKLVTGDSGVIMSDATLFIYNSASNPNVEMRFLNLFPTNLSDIAFDLRNNDVEYMEATVGFTFERFDIIQK